MERQEFKFMFFLEEGSDGGWAGMCPDLPGLLLAGDTRAEMLASAKEVVADYLVEMERRNLPLPTPGERLIEITVPA